jgi:Secretion system C-terminal sorting domain
MTKIYRIFKTQLLLAVVLFVALAGFAQVQPKVVVQVPSGCRVVVPGFGGNVASAAGVTPVVPGRVGTGGIIIMPDPYDETTLGNFICTTILDASTPTPVSIKGWSLGGDLSLQTTTTSGTALQALVYNSVLPAVLPTSATVNIQSYNKTLRSPSESQSPSTPNLARSRGTVGVSYVSGACGGGISFDVYKTYGLASATYLPPIIGPPCVKPNTTYTYSVDQIASDNINTTSPDNYYWYFTGGLSVLNSYTSADNSSITFTTPNSLPTTSFGISCCYGRANTWDGNNGGSNKTCVSLPLKITPIAPSFTPTLNATNCIATGSAPILFTTPNNAAYTYGWTSSDPTWIMTQSLAGTTRTFKIDFNGSNNPGKVTLKINSSCDPVEFTYQINRTLASGLGITAVGGTAPVVCLTTATSYSLPQNAIGNFTTWKIDTIPAGGTLPAGAPTVTNGGAPNSSTTVTPGTASGQFSLVATANTATTCTSTNTRITINIPAAAPQFKGNSANCVLKSATGITNIQVDTTAGQPTTGYVWTITPAGSGWTIDAVGNTSSTPTFNSGSGTGPVTITVYRGIAGGTCNSAIATRSISYIALTTTISPTAECDYYTVNACGAAVTWTVNGAAPTGNFTLTPSGNTLGLCSATTATVIVCATIAGISTPLCTTNTGHGFRLNNSTSLSNPKEIIEGVSIFPNPNNGVFFVKVEDIKESATAQLNDFSGNQIATYILKKGTNKLGNEELPKGTYILVLKVDGKQESRQVIIQ